MGRTRRHAGAPCAQRLRGRRSRHAQIARDPPRDSPVAEVGRDQTHRAKRQRAVHTGTGK